MRILIFIAIVSLVSNVSAGSESGYANLRMSTHTDISDTQECLNSWDFYSTDSPPAYDQYERPSTSSAKFYVSVESIGDTRRFRTRAQSKEIFYAGTPVVFDLTHGVFPKGDDRVYAEEIQNPLSSIRVGQLVVVSDVLPKSNSFAACIYIDTRVLGDYLAAPKKGKRYTPPDISKVVFSRKILVGSKPYEILFKDQQLRVVIKHL